MEMKSKEGHSINYAPVLRFVYTCNRRGVCVCVCMCVCAGGVSVLLQ